MALGETTIHVSPSLSYVHLRSLFPPRLSSFLVVSSPSIFFCFMRFLLDMDLSRALFLARFSSIGASICVLVSFCGLLFSFSFFIWRIFICLFLLLLGLMSAKSHLHVQLIRAELSSKSSSEPLSESFAELSSHQKARPNLFRSRLQAELSSNPSCLSLRGSTTAKGLYAKFFFVLYHYAFGGVGAQCVLFALGTPLRPRGRIGVFRRREGPPRLPVSDIPFFRL